MRSTRTGLSPPPGYADSPFCELMDKFLYESSSQYRSSGSADRSGTLKTAWGAEPSPADSVRADGLRA